MRQGNLIMGQSKAYAKHGVANIATQTQCAVHRKLNRCTHLHIHTHIYMRNVDCTLGTLTLCWVNLIMSQSNADAREKERPANGATQWAVHRKISRCIHVYAQCALLIAQLCTLVLWQVNLIMGQSSADARQRLVRAEACQPNGQLSTK